MCAFLTLAILAVGLLRPIVRWCFGAGPVYALWIVPVLACLAAFVPRQLGPRVLLTDAGSPGVVQPAMAEGGPEVALVVLGVWLLGAALAGVMLYGWHRRFQSEIEPTIRAGSFGGVPLLLSAGVAAPVVSDVRRPRIVLPDSFEHMYGRAARQLILAHEPVHLRRCDPVANVIAGVIVCLFWFHPVAYWANSRWMREQALERYLDKSRVSTHQLLNADTDHW